MKKRQAIIQAATMLFGTTGFDATTTLEIAKEAGNVKAANVALVGALSSLMTIPEETFIEVIKQRVPARFLDVNLTVFAEGRKAGQA